MRSRLLPTPENPLGLAVRLLVASAAGGAMAAAGWAEADAASAAESLYLAFLATPVLLSVAALALPPALELGAGAALAVACVWALPPGPGRGAALVALLVALLAGVAARRLAARGDGLLPGVSVPLALALQLLLRGDQLLAPRLDPHTLVIFLGLPLAAAFATSILAAHHGVPRALGAAALAVVLAPGWNVASTLALAALAAGSRFAAERRDGRYLLLPLLALPVLWEPRSGWGTAIAGAVLAFPAFPFAAVALAAGLGLGALVIGAPVPGLLGLAGLLLLAPGVVLPAERRRWLAVAAALLAAFVPWIPDRTVLAAPLGLAALGAREGGPAAVAERFWRGALVVGVCLAAAYPWIRRDALSAVLTGLGLGARFPLALVPAALLLALWGLERLSAGGLVDEKRFAASRLGATVAAAAVGVALFAHLPARIVPLLPAATAVRLTADHPFWQGELPAPSAAGTEGVGRGRALVVESSLANGAALPSGTPVAEVIAPDGARRVLRAGSRPASGRRGGRTWRGSRGLGRPRLGLAGWRATSSPSATAPAGPCPPPRSAGPAAPAPLRIERWPLCRRRSQVALNAVGVEAIGRSAPPAAVLAAGTRRSLLLARGLPLAGRRSVSRRRSSSCR